MAKRFINIILLLVLSVTILPIKQVGNALFNNQWTEELNGHSDHPSDKGGNPGKWAYIGHSDLLHAHPGLETRETGRFFCYSQSLPFNASREIHSPPPNLF